MRIELDTKKANCYFFNYVFNSPIVRNQINAISRQIIGQANINTEEVGDLKIPLPPLKTQKVIVAKIEKMRAEVQKLRSLSADISYTAQEQLQSAIVKN